MPVTAAALKKRPAHAKHDYILIAERRWHHPLEGHPRLPPRPTNTPWSSAPAPGPSCSAAAAQAGQMDNHPPRGVPQTARFPDLNSGFRVFRKDVAMRHPALPEGFRSPPSRWR